MRSWRLLPGWQKPQSQPSGWELVQLNAVSRTIAGGRLGFTKESDYRPSGVPAFSAAGQDGFVSRAEFENVDAVVLSSVGAQCGKCFPAQGSWSTLANVQAILTAGTVSARYLYFRVNRDDYWPRSGSAQPFIKPSDIGRCWIALPPLAEQRRIAEILDTLDEAIRKTEQLIAKLRQVKQGLLHDLLTRGIDENGELRDPERNPEEFKASRLGPIPVNWDVETLGNLVEEHQAGIYKDRGEYGSGGNIVGVADLFRHESIDGQVFRRVRLSDSERDEFALHPGDLIYAESSLVLDGIAKTLAVTEQGAGTAFAWHTRRLSLRRGRADAEFLALALGLPRSRAFVVTRATQTAITGIPVSEYLSTPLALPPLNAQKQMVEIVRMHDARALREMAFAEKLRLLKGGLMDDLLTGRVRAASPGTDTAA
ncbi:MAG: restriction endonuclease subunit S [Anaeromyxobacteraceae bacterium]